MLPRRASPFGPFRENRATSNFQTGSYLGGIANTNLIKPHQIGGVDDHIHMLLGLPSTVVLMPPMFSRRSNVQSVCAGRLWAATAIALQITNTANAPGDVLEVINVSTDEFCGEA